jgi:hypothetical protein
MLNARRFSLSSIPIVGPVNSSFLSARARGAEGRLCGVPLPYYQLALLVRLMLQGGARQRVKGRRAWTGRPGLLGGYRPSSLCRGDRCEAPQRRSEARCDQAWRPPISRHGSWHFTRDDQKTAWAGSRTDDRHGLLVSKAASARLPVVIGLCRGGKISALGAGRELQAYSPPIWPARRMPAASTLAGPATSDASRPGTARSTALSGATTAIPGLPEAHQSFFRRARCRRPAEGARTAARTRHLKRRPAPPIRDATSLCCRDFGRNAGALSSHAKRGIAAQGPGPSSAASRHGRGHVARASCGTVRSVKKTDGSRGRHRHLAPCAG